MAFVKFGRNAVQRACRLALEDLNVTGEQRSRVERLLALAAAARLDGEVWLSAEDFDDIRAGWKAMD